MTYRYSLQRHGERTNGRAAVVLLSPSSDLYGWSQSPRGFGLLHNVTTAGVHELPPYPLSGAAVAAASRSPLGQAAVVCLPSSIRRLYAKVVSHLRPPQETRKAILLLVGSWSAEVPSLSPRGGRLGPRTLFPTPLSRPRLSSAGGRTRSCQDNNNQHGALSLRTLLFGAL